MNSAVDEILEIKKKFKQSKNSKKELEDMEKSIKDFQEMVDDGLVQPRGYTLKTINDECFTYSSNISY
ncbi:hypothetical protein KZO53_13160 [Prevotella melaninogenica]|jgi:hypothetical protein|uniref:hypothetical protein n=1 Tax=Prevotella melaninogenica TaxID=28132 RepID=UPI001C5D3220|nr:hypothetical protein [Prevotella melaninogenica]MBW4763394.1 hypothetical protein [Prevotella melaninogenica]